MTAEKGSLEYIKEKRKEYNRKYQEKLKQRLNRVELIEENTDETVEPKTDFFFQTKKNTKPEQIPQPVVLKMPETSITTQIKNQLIMGSLTMVPMVLSILLKRLEARRNNSSQNQSTTQSQVLEMQPPPSFW